MTRRIAQVGVAFCLSGLFLVISRAFAADVSVGGGDPAIYVPSTPDAVSANLRRLRALAAQGAISPEDALRAEQELHQTQTVVTTVPLESSPSSPAMPVPSDSAAHYSYVRPNSGVSIDVSGILSEADFAEISGLLDRHSDAFLGSIRQIAVSDAVGDGSALGQKAVDDSKQTVTLYGLNEIEDALAMGIAAHQFDYGLTSQDRASWLVDGSRADYIFSYAERLAPTSNPFVPTLAQR